VGEPRGFEEEVLFPMGFPPAALSFTCESVKKKFLKKNSVFFGFCPRFRGWDFEGWGFLWLVWLYLRGMVPGSLGLRVAIFVLFLFVFGGGSFWSIFFLRVLNFFLTRFGRDFRKENSSVDWCPAVPLRRGVSGVARNPGYSHPPEFCQESPRFGPFPCFATDQSLSVSDPFSWFPVSSPRTSGEMYVF